LSPSFRSGFRRISVALHLRRRRDDDGAPPASAASQAQAASQTQAAPPLERTRRRTASASRPPRSDAPVGAPGADAPRRSAEPLDSRPGTGTSDRGLPRLVLTRASTRDDSPESRREPATGYLQPPTGNNHAQVRFEAPHVGTDTSIDPVAAVRDGSPASVASSLRTLDLPGPSRGASPAMRLLPSEHSSLSSLAGTEDSGMSTPGLDSSGAPLESAARLLAGGPSALPLLGAEPSMLSIADQYGSEVASWAESLRPLSPWHPDEELPPQFEPHGEPEAAARPRPTPAAAAVQHAVQQVPFQDFAREAAQAAAVASSATPGRPQAPAAGAQEDDPFATFDADMASAQQPPRPEPARAGGGGAPSAAEVLRRQRAALDRVLADADAGGGIPSSASPADRELRERGERTIRVYARRALAGLREPRELEAPTRPASRAAGSRGAPALPAADRALLDRLLEACTGAGAPRTREAWSSGEMAALARSGGRLIEACLQRRDTDTAARVAGLLLPGLAARRQFTDGSRLRERLALAQPRPGPEAEAMLEIGVAHLVAAQGRTAEARTRVLRATHPAGLEQRLPDLRLRTHALRERLALGALDDRERTRTRLQLGSDLARLGQVNAARIEVARAARSVITHGFVDESLRCLEVQANIAEFEGRRRPRPGERVEARHAYLCRAVTLLRLYCNRCENLLAGQPRRLPMLRNAQERLQRLASVLTAPAYTASLDAAAPQLDRDGNEVEQLGLVELLRWASEARNDEAA
jgi:hypothetical protein